MQKLFTLTSDFKLSQDQKNAVDGIVKALMMARNTPRS